MCIFFSYICNKGSTLFTSFYSHPPPYPSSQTKYKCFLCV
uniref:Uncharacterized protein n=1 Tax=Rhizophora mucronata TaxID=61149 RepID=A0A2P2R0B6_RHIMU